MTIAARKAGIYKSVLWGWMRGRYLPSIRLLLSLCMANGVSLVSVMEGSPVQCFCPREIKPPKRSNSKPSKENREIVLKEALSANPPRSVSAVASMLGLDPSSLRRQFPELCALITERFRHFNSLQAAARREAAKKLSESLINEVTSKGLPLTRRNFQAAAGRPIMPYSLLHRVLKEVLQGGKFSAN